ncbi:MAG TPA: 1-acyl-sn-glycerol-3-phosphate acyltransferase [Pseudomonadales bacterium]|nr:1-acyl-sn-glycerol-3-phosphate acyltransferase [Pseudomonadales bacterium]
MENVQRGMDDSQDTRPCVDADVPRLVGRLLNDREFVEFLGRYHSPTLARWCPFLVRTLVKRRLGKLLGDVETIADFQKIVATYAQKLIDETMTVFRHNGLEQLDPEAAYLYVSNHRDIAGDSMLVDFVLFRSGLDTVRIAVGDNLVQRQFATDLMTLNKSFFIKRSAEGAKKIYAALLDSSKYIHESLAEGQSVWIAQAEGRAKDCVDETDPALIKMFALAGRKRPFNEVIAELNILPVAISYEFDPCDVLKAKELHAIRAEGKYSKPPGEDLLSLVKGLGGFKGEVHVTFGKVLDGSFETPDQVAEEVDRQVLANLKLFPVNFLALRRLAESGAGAEFAAAWDGVAAIATNIRDPRFDERLSACPVEWQTEWLTMYANPILNKQRHGIPVSLG